MEPARAAAVVVQAGVTAVRGRRCWGMAQRTASGAGRIGWWRPGGGPGGGAGAEFPEVGAVGDFPKANSISAVCRDSCHPPWNGVNSIGKVKSALFAWAVCTAMVAFTFDGFLSDHAMSFALKVMGR